MKPSAPPTHSFRDNYDKFGVDGYYGEFGAKYLNPHEGDIRRALRAVLPKWRQAGLSFDKTLDLACGSGEASVLLTELLAPATVQIDATDPYTHEAYRERTGRSCDKISFEDIENGAYEGRSYTCIVCCFALHLVDDSRLPALCAQLALLGRQLLIISPHKRPEIATSTGWALREESVVDRIRLRWYESMLAS